jgi:hypothetical protein
MLSLCAILLQNISLFWNGNAFLPCLHGAASIKIRVGTSCLAPPSTLVLVSALLARNKALDNYITSSSTGVIELSQEVFFESLLHGRS